MGKSSDAEGIRSEAERELTANHLAQASSALPAHTQPLTGEGTGYSHKRVAPKIGPVLRTTDFDRVLHAMIGRLTGGVSPTALTLAYLDWIAHLAIQPGKQSDLAQAAIEKFNHLVRFATRCALHYDRKDCAELRDSDARFRTESWGRWPFNVFAEAFLLGEEWWQQTTSTVQGVSQHHRDLLSFLARQLTDTCSPSNFPWTNPDILKTTQEQLGTNLLKGGVHAIEDLARHFNHRQPVGAEPFAPGSGVALTPGKVIYRNRLMELIQYSPQTGLVHAEPLLIVPAWIMKYYILDLSPQNSLVRYLVEHGHTVFMISWINPGQDEGCFGLDDYRRMGIMEALDAVQAVLPGQKVHAVGYCLGGTLLTLSAAAMAREGDDRLATVSLFAAQVDFEEAGELLLFIDEAQLTFLENMMAEQGYLDKDQLSAAFNLLRSKDLVWSKVVDEYLEGERQPMFDLMAWSADATRLPFRMHSEYLRSLFLNNDLAEGRYIVDGDGIALTDIRVPIFAVGTEKDHIAPWRSVYKVHLYTDTEVTFVLTSGGHNAGIISEPGRARRGYRMTSHEARDHYLHPARWYATAPAYGDSWWSAWLDWLAERSHGRITPPAIGAPEKGIVALDDAPGSYVHQA
ncbi:PHA/PHB synthase family protein [Dechloromonas sp. A34]|uniref:PHA/PHB synthase family protein n=1 Tax=Dechloromonas sp. A34 TaxID=447588 RepID=UPI0022496129|nr:alpha/beta fold hydrolase [Dechloromonas sp. A34]